MKAILRYLSLSLCLSCWVALAQEAPKDTLKVLDDKTLVIEKEQNLELMQVNKRFNKMNYVPKHNRNNNLDYVFSLPDYKSEALEIDLKVSNLDTLYDFETRDGYVKLGLGNFGTGHLHGLLNKSVSKFHYVADIFVHHSLTGPVDKDYSASNSSYAKLLADYVLDSKHSLGLGLGYDFRRRHYYGYEEKPSNPKAIRQDLKVLKADLKYTGMYSSSSARSQFSFYNWQNTAAQRETLLNFNLDYEQQFQSSNKFNLIFKGVYNTQDNLSRHLVTLGGGYLVEKPKLNFELGLRLTYLTDTTLDQKPLNIYPKLALRYLASPYFNIFAELSGSIQENYLKTLTQANPFLAQDLVLSHSNKTLHTALGFDFQYKRLIGMRLLGSYNLVDNMVFMLNNRLDLAKFDLYYDDASVLNIKLESYFKTEYFRANISVEQSFYSLKRERQAWHKPLFKATLNLQYQHEKWDLKSDVYMLQDIYSFDFQKIKSLTDSKGDQILPTIYDVNLGFNYQFNSKFYVFIEANNVLATSYQKYYRYITKTFNALVGFTLIF